MSTKAFRHETKLILDAASRYREALAKLQGPEQLAPYDHLTLPGTKRLSEFLYRSLVADHAQQLANDVNRLCYHTEQLAAWNVALTGCNPEEQLILLNEFVDATAVVSVALPYSIRSRFHFSVAHISHQANLLTRPDWKESWLPSDTNVSFKTMVKVANCWKAFAQLAEQLNKLNDTVFVKSTGDFRNKYNHRFPPRFVLGYTQVVMRMPKETGATSYGIGGVPPLELSVVVAALRTQCNIALESFARYSSLVEEQVAAIALLSNKP